MEVWVRPEWRTTFSTKRNLSRFSLAWQKRKKRSAIWDTANGRTTILSINNISVERFVRLAGAERYRRALLRPLPHLHSLLIVINGFQLSPHTVLENQTALR